MKTYTRHSIAGWDVYTDDETGRVHHLVDPDSNDPRTLYPYIPAAGGGWDNACGSLTLSALSRRPPRTPDHPPGILWYLYTKTFLRFIAFLCVLPYHGSNEIH